MKIKFALVLLLGSLTHGALAEETISLSPNTIFEPDFQTELQTNDKFQKPNFNNQPSQQQNINVSLSLDELLKQPELMKRLLGEALQRNDSKIVALVLPVYQNYLKTLHTISEAESSLNDWASAVVAQSQGNYSQAVKLYRALNAKYPEHQIIRLQMAISLFNNYENEAAQDQFERIKADNENKNVTVLIDRYLEAIRHRSDWSFQLGASYFKDNNVNNAPKAGTYIGRFKAYEPEKASGIFYRLTTSKQWILAKQYYALLEADATGKYFFDNKKYNELSAELGLSLGYRDGTYDIRFGPYMKKNWYAGGNRNSHALRSFSEEWGAQAQASAWLSPKWRVSSYLSLGHEKYQRNQYLTGNNLTSSLSLSYVPSSTQFWTLGFDAYRRNAEEKGSAYDLANVRLGWNQDYNWGVSTYLQLSYAKRKYKDKHFFFNIKQKNDEYGALLSVWHRDIHWKGFTPRVSVAYQHVKSNNLFYQYDKARVFLDFRKRF